MMKSPLLILIFFSVGCLCFLLGRCTRHDTDIVTVSVHDTIPGKIPPPITRYIPIPQYVDTAAILREHFAENIYDDTIVRFPELKVRVQDIVSENRLLDRQIIVDYQRPKPNKKNAIVFDSYFAVGSFPLMVGYRHKKLTYKVGYDVINKSVVGGISIDLYQW